MRVAKKRVSGVRDNKPRVQRIEPIPFAAIEDFVRETKKERISYEGVFQVVKREGSAKYKGIDFKQVIEDCPQTTRVRMDSGRDTLEIKVDPYERKNIIYEITACSVQGRNKLVRLLKALCEQEPKYTPFTVERRKLAYIEEGVLEKEGDGCFSVFLTLLQEAQSEEREDSGAEDSVEVYIKTGRKGCIPCLGERFDYDCDKCMEWLENHREIYVEDRFLTPFWRNPEHCEKYGMPKPLSSKKGDENG